MIEMFAKQKILIVDDTPSNIKILIGMFSSGYDVAIATNGEEALQATAAFIPDLILLDIELPKLDGYEVCIRLKGDPRTRSIPIIFLTGRDNELDEAKGLQLGASDYITRPFCPDVAIARVENHLALKRHQDVMEQMIKELKEARELAEQASRSKGEFLSNMSHEIRTPMNAILGLTDLALSLQMPLKVRDYLAKIANSSKSLLRIINDILDFSKIEAGKLELEMSDFLLRDVFDHLADMFRSKITEKHMELILCVSEECGYELCGDSLRLEQVLMNLMSNALKFTEEGEIEVQVKSSQESVQEVTLEFSVRDTGIGMTDEHQNKLFQPFTQADSSVTRKFGGTGLGLSISKNLVEMMGGKIWIRSEVGRGSTFYFTTVFQRKLGSETEDFIPPEDMEHLKALIVDDNYASRNALQKLLETFSFAAKGVASGQEAIHAIEQSIIRKNPYQLMLVDWLMPEINGIQVLRQLKNTIALSFLPKTILLVPYHREEELRLLGNEIGVNAYLPKPINCSILFDTIMNVFGKNITKAFRVGKGVIDTKKIVERIGGARVLLVEDNSINQQVAREILEELNLIIEIANDGLEAISKVTETAYDIVLMDIQMPEMDGYQATREIRKDPEFDVLPIVAMTANAMTGDREKCFRAGMNDHISKPIDRVHLYKALVKWIVPRAGLGLNAPVKQNENSKKEEIMISTTLAGIDIGEAMIRFNGNHRLYRTLLFEFHRNYAESFQQIQAYLTARRKDDIISAIRLAHTVKGVAGNISAKRLYEAASALEEDLKHLPGEVITTLNIYRDALKEVVEAIGVMRESELAPREDTSCCIGMSPAEIQKIFTPLIIELSQQLAKKAYKAKESFENLHSHLMCVPMEVREEIKHLGERIEKFDFKTALQLLTIVAEKLKVDLKAGSK
ncbi:two-component system, sensor histidine kinase and response regulator [Gammaproteobacteria bacterium]